ncbi:MAG: hypothetical protein PVH29_09915 [Candidatus Zixiibacteriota bacterium]|jgi:hypothetical protein
MRDILLIVALVLTLAVSASHGLLEIKGGTTTPLSELEGRYGGGPYASLGGEARLPWWPVSVMADLSYTALGRDRPLSDLFANYGEKRHPGVLPWADVINGLNLKSVFYGGSAGVRYYPVEYYAFAPYAEAGGVYLYRELTAYNIPVGILGRYVLGLDISVPSTQGFGMYTDLGVRGIPGLPLISIDAGVRFVYGPGLARTGFEEFLEENIPTYDAPDSDGLFMASFYLGASLF